MTGTSIVLLRPRSLDDPSMMMVNGCYLFADLLQQLIVQNIFRRVILSLPEDTPSEFIEIVAQWHLPFALSDHSAAPPRLLEVFDSFGLTQVIVLAAYSYLLDTKTLHEAQSTLESGKADCVASVNASPAKYFCGLNHRALHRLNDKTPTANPFTFFQQLSAHSKDLELIGLADVESNAERYIAQLCEEGAIPLFPRSFILSNYPPNRTNWFLKRTHQNLLCQSIQTEDLSWLEQFLEKNPVLTPRDLTNHSSQIDWTRRMKHYLRDESGGTFLEVGFGNFPVSAAMLLDKYHRGIAVEIVQSDEKLLISGLELLVNLQLHWPHLLPSEGTRLQSVEDTLSRLTLRYGDLEDLALPTNHFDFIFSKGVLYIVQDLAYLLTQMARLLKPGGTMLHQTAGFYWSEYHQLPDFSHLEFSREQWSVSGRPGNNWRLDDINALLKSLGLRVNTLSVEYPPHFVAPKKLHPSWESYPDSALYFRSGIIQASKPQ